MYQTPYRPRLSCPQYPLPKTTHSKEGVIDDLQDTILGEGVGHLVTLDDHVLTQDLDGVEMVAALKGRKKENRNELYSGTRNELGTKINHCILLTLFEIISQTK